MRERPWSLSSSYTEFKTFLSVNAEKLECSDNRKERHRKQLAGDLSQVAFCIRLMCRGLFQKAFIIFWGLKKKSTELFLSQGARGKLDIHCWVLQLRLQSRFGLQQMVSVPGIIFKYSDLQVAKVSSNNCLVRCFSN